MNGKVERAERLRDVSPMLGLHSRQWGKRKCDEFLLYFVNKKKNQMKQKKKNYDSAVNHLLFLLFISFHLCFIVPIGRKGSENMDYFN